MDGRQACIQDGRVTRRKAGWPKTCRQIGKRQAGWLDATMAS